MMESKLDPVLLERFGGEDPSERGSSRFGTALVVAGAACAIVIAAGALATSGVFSPPSDPGALRGEWRMIPVPGGRILNGSLLDFEPGEAVEGGLRRSASFDTSHPGSVGVTRAGGASIVYRIDSPAMATAGDGSIIVKVRR